MYANFTPRSDKYMKFQDSERRVVVVGPQFFAKDYLINEWDTEFFSKPKAEVVAKFKRRMDTSLGQDAISVDHITALHDLGYLPISLKALPEGSKVQFKVPVLTLTNTHPDFAWLVTYLETVLSSELWPVLTSATTAYQFWTLCNRYADATVGNRNHVMFQCHDFSARGLMGRYATRLSGMGHLTCFSGTDTIAAIDLVEDFYNVDASKYFIAGSVPASEHSVTSLGIAVEGEFETLDRWLTESYPVGLVSIVSDTLDYWKVLTEFLPKLKDKILARQPSTVAPGKVVIRPDSGDPVRIVAGYREDEVMRIPAGRNLDGTEHNGKIIVKAAQAYDQFEITENEFKGSIEVLYEIFGGTVNAQGYKQLDPHIGLIYGDSITLQRAEEIFSRLQQRGFATDCVVFGVGSYTYQMVSRDTLGIAMKATYAVVDGKGYNLFKDPATDDGTKKSAKGLLRVELEDGKYVLYDQQTKEQEKQGLLQEIFRDSEVTLETDWDEIRHRVQDIPYPAEEEEEVTE